MSAKEKAQQIYDKCIDHANFHEFFSHGEYPHGKFVYDDELGEKNAKKLALFMVDEILEISDPMSYGDGEISQKEAWQQVKLEISKL